MRILVTGGAGFIGSHVVERLVGLGHQVWVVDSLESGSRAFVSPQAILLEGDVRHPEVWADQVGEVNVVIHLAAQVSVSRGEASPIDDGSTNLMGTLKVLAWAQDHGAREFRFASSAAVYGNPAYLPLDEHAPLAPQSFYGIHKRAAEWDIRHFCQVHNMASVIFRLANVYGPRQRAEGEGAVVAAFAGALASGRPPVIHGDGGQSRDFIFVGDVARAFSQGLGELRGQEITANIGTGEGTSIMEIWHHLADIAGADPEAIGRGPLRAGDIRDSVLSVERARQMLRFDSEMPLREGLRRTYQHFLTLPPSAGV